MQQKSMQKQLIYQRNIEVLVLIVKLRKPPKNWGEQLFLLLEIGWQVGLVLR